MRIGVVYFADPRSTIFTRLCIGQEHFKQAENMARHKESAKMSLGIGFLGQICIRTWLMQVVLVYGVLLTNTIFTRLIQTRLVLSVRSGINKDAFHTSRA